MRARVRAPLLDDGGMPEPSPALGRLVANENSASDLLAFLFEKDPAPLIRVLGLPGGDYRCRREGRASKSRLDLVVYRQDQPVAVLEMKGASSEHGDQLDRYEAWAVKRNPEALLFYCSLDHDHPLREPWRAIGLVELFGAWRDSSDPHTAWLAGEIADLLRSWDEQAENIIGEATGWYVADLVTRRIGRYLDDALRKAHPGDGEAAATRTSPGNPMFLAWRRHPLGSEHAWIGVDVRCEGRDDPAAAWSFRPCVEVEPGGRPATDAMLEAHDLAETLWPAMVLSAVQKMLTDRGRPDLAAVLSARKHGGLAAPADAGVLDAWRSAIVADEVSGKHPVFRNDWNRRLATQFALDVTLINRADLAELTLAVLDHLMTYAMATGSRQPG
jgi:hypothetical protein